MTFPLIKEVKDILKTEVKDKMIVGGEFRVKKNAYKCSFM
jgi:hypothetical protein